MTMREVSVALRQIDERVYNAFAIQARWHGVDAPIRGQDQEIEVNREDPALNDLAEKALRSAQERKRQEFVNG